MAASTTPSRTRPSSGAARPPGPVDRAFALLQIIVASSGPIGVRELARQAGLAPSTTSRTVGILDDLEMIERTPEGAIRPGSALATLTNRVADSPASLRDRLRPLTTNLVHRFGENAAIAVDECSGVLYVVSSRVGGALQVPDPTGDLHAFHLVAPGLVAMAHWDEPRLAEYLTGPLASATPFSVINPAKIRKRVAGVRRATHAWTDQELDVDVNGLAVPILGPDGNLLAIASLYGPAHRLNPIERPELGQELAAHVLDRTADLR